MSEAKTVYPSGPVPLPDPTRITAVKDEGGYWLSLPEFRWVTTDVAKPPFLAQVVRNNQTGEIKWKRLETLVIAAEDFWG